jgi:hypothetical protein
VSFVGILVVIVALGFFVLDIIAIVDVIRRPMDTAMKILWVILILWLPIIGPILYYLLGRGKQNTGS